MNTPRIYRFDQCDEMTLASLAVLAEIRQRLIAHHSDDPDSGCAAAGVVDQYATEIVKDARDDEDEDDDARPAPPRDRCPYCTTSLEDQCPWHLSQAGAHPDPEASA